MLLACGVFDRKDVVKHVHTPMISWHGQTGTVFCVDIQPSGNTVRLRRVATGGSDNNVQVRYAGKYVNGKSINKRKNWQFFNQSMVNTFLNTYLKFGGGAYRYTIC